MKIVEGEERYLNLGVTMRGRVLLEEKRAGRR